MASKATKARLVEARRLLKHAEEQWDQAAVASWAPAEPADCVTNAFYAYENALMAAARALGKATTTKHYEKARLAKEMFSNHQLKTDVSKLIHKLNDVRKDVQYGEPGPELRGWDLEEACHEARRFLA